MGICPRPSLQDEPLHSTSHYPIFVLFSCIANAEKGRRESLEREREEKGFANKRKAEKKKGTVGGKGFHIFVLINEMS